MPPRRTTPKGYEHARALRKEPTPAERKLWTRLRNRQLNGVKFRRQHAIGIYIPDFCAIKEKLIIELDGSQHLEQAEYDEERTNYFKSLGYKVIRIWNNQIMNDMPGVILAIMDALDPHPRRSPKFDNENLGSDENPPVEFGGGAR
jgi:very-short-patch-repair endonuclease